jgi:hypothetical protein
MRPSFTWLAFVIFDCVSFLPFHHHSEGEPRDLQLGPL